MSNARKKVQKKLERWQENLDEIEDRQTRVRYQHKMKDLLLTHKRNKGRFGKLLTRKYGDK